MSESVFKHTTRAIFRSGLDFDVYVSQTKSVLKSLKGSPTNSDEVASFAAVLAAEAEGGRAVTVTVKSGGKELFDIRMPVGLNGVQLTIQEAVDLAEAAANEMRDF